eukprot:2919894-Ditylum_brightwellii.AAC.1
MSSTGPNYGRKLHLGLVQALVPCYGLVLVYEYLLDCIGKNNRVDTCRQVRVRSRFGPVLDISTQ